MSNVDITVILTCYQERELLRRAVASLDRQTDLGFKLIVVNDASTCGITNNICKELSARANTRVLVRERNGGLSAARDDGFQAANEGVCIPLDADDVLPDYAVQKIREVMATHPDADFYYGDYFQCNVDGGEIARIDCAHLSDASGWLMPRRLAQQWVLLGTSPCRRKTWARVNGYGQTFTHDCQDIDFWMRVLATGAKGFYVDQPIYQWNRSNSGMNAKVRSERIWEVQLANKRFHQLCSTWLFVEERFIDEVLAKPLEAGMRHLMRAYAWQMLPVTSDLKKRFVRAWIKSWLPFAWVDCITILKRKISAQPIRNSKRMP